MAKAGGFGKRKGSAFERTVCEQLSRLIDPDTEETLFWRSAMSGGRSTVRGKKGKADATQAGDITCIDPKGNWLTAHFIIECKFYHNLDIQTALLTGKGKLAKFWREVRKVAKKHKKYPMLVARENRTKTLLLLGPKGHKSMTTWQGRKIPWLVECPNLNCYVIDYEKEFLQL